MFSIVTYRHFADTVDAYGQQKKGTYTDSTVEMYIRAYASRNGDNPKFVDANYIGLTKANITAGDDIISGSDTYEVLYVMPTDRYNQIFMRLK